MCFNKSQPSERKDANLTKIKGLKPENSNKNTKAKDVHETDNMGKNKNKDFIYSDDGSFGVVWLDVTVGI